MKFLFLSVAFAMNTMLGIGQLKTTTVCPTFNVDVLTGFVNDLQSKSTLGEIKTFFPCFSETVEVTTSPKCLGVFYKDKDIYFYTERNYIEIGPNFKGKLTPQLIGVSRSNLFKILGYPKIKDVNWDAFQMQYGTLILYYGKDGKTNKLQMTNRSTDSIKLCE